MYNHAGKTVRRYRSTPYYYGAIAVIRRYRTKNARMFCFGQRRDRTLPPLTTKKWGNVLIYSAVYSNLLWIKSEYRVVIECWNCLRIDLLRFFHDSIQIYTWNFVPRFASAAYRLVFSQKMTFKFEQLSWFWSNHILIYL